MKFTYNTLIISQCPYLSIKYKDYSYVSDYACDEVCTGTGHNEYIIYCHDDKNNYQIHFDDEFISRWLTKTQNDKYELYDCLSMEFYGYIQYKSEKLYGYILIDADITIRINNMELVFDNIDVIINDKYKDIKPLYEFTKKTLKDFIYNNLLLTQVSYNELLNDYQNTYYFINSKRIIKCDIMELKLDEDLDYKVIGKAKINNIGQYESDPVHDISISDYTDIEQDIELEVTYNSLNVDSDDYLIYKDRTLC